MARVVRALLSRYGRPAGDAEIQAKLKDPVAVHVNMLRGTIAPITFDQLAHVLGDEATAAWIASRPAGDAQPVAWTTPDGREPISDAVKRARPDLYDKAYTVALSKYSAPVAAQKANDADPLQGAADWLVKSLAKPRPSEIAARLLIGYNRAERLFDAAIAQQRQEGRQ